MVDKKPIMKSIRFDPEIEKMLSEMCADNMRSQNNMVNLCVREYYRNFFKKS